MEGKLLEEGPSYRPVHAERCYRAEDPPEEGDGSEGEVSVAMADGVLEAVVEIVVAVVFVVVGEMLDVVDGVDTQRPQDQ